MLRPLLVAAPLLALLAGCAPSGYPPALPRDADALEPPVRRLVERRIAAVEANPADPEAHALLGAAYQANGLLRPATESYAQAAALDPDEPLWPYYTARGLKRMGRLVDARARLDEALARDDSFAPAHQLLGWIQLDEGEMEAARRSFERARGVATDRAEPLVGLATVALEEGDAARSREFAEAALARNAGNPHARFVLGRALVALGEIQDGRAEMEAGKDSATTSLHTSFYERIEESRVNRSGVLERAAVLSDRGQGRSALAMLDELAKDFPDDPILHSLRGSALQSVGRDEDASEAYLRALQLDETLPRTWEMLADVQLRIGNMRGAREAAQRAVALDDTLDDAWAALSIVELNDGDLQGALRSGKRAVELRPSKASHHAGLGNVYAVAGQHAAAQACYERAVELAPDEAELRLAYASASIRLASYDQARKALDRAEEIDPNVRGLASLRRQLEQRAGR